MTGGFFMSQISSTQNSKRQSLQPCSLCDSDRTLFVLGMVKIIPMPYGGSITLFSMLAATLTGYFCGPKWGLTSGVALGLLNLIIDPVILFPDAGASRLCFGVRTVWGFPDFSAIRKTACTSVTSLRSSADLSAPSSPVSSSSVNTRRKA